MSMRERIASLIAGLAEETGEVNAIIRRHLWRDKRNIRPELLEELGDVLFFVAALADTFGFTMKEVKQSNIAKLRARYPEAFKSDEPAPQEISILEPIQWVEVIPTRLNLVDADFVLLANIHQRSRDKSWSAGLAIGDDRKRMTFYDMDAAKSWCEHALKALRGIDKETDEDDMIVTKSDNGVMIISSKPFEPKLPMGLGEWFRFHSSLLRPSIEPAYVLAIVDPEGREFRASIYNPNSDKRLEASALFPTMLDATTWCDKQLKERWGLQ
jgi:NTP pyrophosphatase (non-canonical NTP hydrolase)